MTKLILVRHGESEANRRDASAGHYDPALEERGILQAEKTAAYIAENYRVDKIYASDLRRTFDTASVLGEKLGMAVTAEQGLREIRAGAWENVPFADLSAMFPQEYALWMSDIGRSGCPGGETVAELALRVMNTLERIAAENDGQSVVIATHATPIRAAQTMITYGTLDKMQQVPWVSNASVSVFERDKTGWRVLSVSEDGHLGELKTVLPDNV